MAEASASARGEPSDMGVGASAIELFGTHFYPFPLDRIECPIALARPAEPVVASDGEVYDLESLRAHARHSRRSPVHRGQLLREWVYPYREGGAPHRLFEPAVEPWYAALSVSVGGCAEEVQVLLFDLGHEAAQRLTFHVPLDRDGTVLAFPSCEEMRRCAAGFARAARVDGLLRPVEHLYAAFLAIDDRPPVRLEDLFWRLAGARNEAP